MTSVGTVLPSLVAEHRNAVLANQLVPRVGTSAITNRRIALAAMLLSALWRARRCWPFRTIMPALIAYGVMLCVGSRRTHPLVVLLLACLYGNLDALKVL